MFILCFVVTLNILLLKIIFPILLSLCWCLHLRLQNCGIFIDKLIIYYNKYIYESIYYIYILVIGQELTTYQTKTLLEASELLIFENILSLIQKTFYQCSISCWESPVFNLVEDPSHSG